MTVYKNIQGKQFLQDPNICSYIGIEFSSEKCISSEAIIKEYLVKMGGQVSQVFQSGSALLSNGHGHKVSDSTRQKVQTIFDALRANPRIGVQRLEGLLQQIPKVNFRAMLGVNA